jgi:tetratricopeptide (TPR) repeat protein
VQEYNVSLHLGTRTFTGCLGNLYADAGRRDQAIESIKKSLEIDPGNARPKAAGAASDAKKHSLRMGNWEILARLDG